MAPGHTEVVPGALEETAATVMAAHTIRTPLLAGMVALVVTAVVVKANSEIRRGKLSL